MLNILKMVTWGTGVYLAFLGFIAGLITLFINVPSGIAILALVFFLSRRL